MFNTLRKYWRLFWYMRKLHAMRMMEYRANFFFWLFISTMWTIFNMFFFTIITNVSGAIAGWSLTEMYLIMGVFNIIDAFVWSFFYNNMMEYTNGIFSGDLNKVLVKPLNPQFWLMTQNNNYANIFRFFLGFGITLWAANRLQLHPSLPQVALFIFMILVSISFIYFLWFIVSTCSFWVEKLDNINEIVPNIRRTFQVPHQVYTGLASTVLTVILPLGLLTSVPSEILLGRVSSWLIVLYLGLFTLGLAVLSHIFFRYSIKKYSGAAN